MINKNFYLRYFVKKGKIGYYRLKVLKLVKKQLIAPVDSYIIEAAQTRVTDTEKTNVYGLGIVLPENYSVEWSRWNKDEYREFIRLVEVGLKKYNKEHNYLEQIEWEAMAWIEQAKINESKSATK